jgi:hypothetical protein
MASVTQKIPNYVAGISEQPDELKFPGQVRDLLNCIPDVTKQLVKRPGSRWVADVDNLQTNEWFSYYRDEQEQYIGCVERTGQINIYDALNGDEETVNRGLLPIIYGSPPVDAGLGPSLKTNPLPYLVHTNPDSIQFLTVNDFTFVTNREQRPRMLAEGTAQTVRSVDCYANFLTNTDEVSATNVATTNITGTGTDMTVDVTVGGTDNRFITALTINTAGTGYTNGDRFTIDGYEGAAGVFLDTAKSAPEVPEGYVEVKILAYGREYKFTVLDANGDDVVEPSVTTAFDATTAISVQTVLDGWATALQGANFTTEIIGNGIYFTRGEEFSIDVLDTQTMNGFTDDVNSFDRLPYQCHNGMIVEVVNTDSSDEDNFFVIFNGDNGVSGSGVWEETVAPNLFIRFDRDRMPHQIVRNADGTFTANFVTWEPMPAGNYDTNPPPSFIDVDNPTGDGEPINKMLLFRNRLVFLSQENVSTSQAGGFFDLFATSVISVSPQDPIDVAASSNQPAILFDGVEINNGLVLFGETQQYLLTSEDSALGLSQDTVKLSSIANFLYDRQIRPAMMGTTVAFTNMGGTSFRLFEMGSIDLQGQPYANELSKVVSLLLPNSLISLANSMEGNLMMFATDDDNRENEVWGFRYYTVGDERKQQAWFRWTLPGDVLFHAIMRDTYYAVCRVEGQNKILAFDLKETENTALFNDNFRVHLDSRVTIDVSDDNVTFDAGTNRTTFDITGFSGGTPFAYELTTGNYQPVTLDLAVTPNRGTVQGDWTGADFWVGYLFDMRVEIPKFYVVEESAGANVAVKSDTRASLVIHRFNVEAGATGVFQVTLERQGYDDYTETYYPNVADNYRANDPMMVESLTRTIPCYIRNKQMDVELHSRHPSPFTLFSISWEGDFSNKYYRSV